MCPSPVMQTTNKVLASSPKKRPRSGHHGPSPELNGATTTDKLTTVHGKRSFGANHGQNPDEDNGEVWEEALKKRKVVQGNGPETNHERSNDRVQEADQLDAQDVREHPKTASDVIGNGRSSRKDKYSESRPRKFKSAEKESELKALDADLKGMYIPPHRRRAMEVEGKEGDALERTQVQRKSWDVLKKTINGLINKANESNLPQIIIELFRQNLLRGTGLFCRSLLKSQMSSPEFSHVYASLVCVINSKVPEIGETFLHRLLAQLRRGLKMRKKVVIQSSMTFIAHLFDQQVCDELLPLEIISYLIDAPTDDSIELVADFVKLTGALLSETSPKILDSMFAILREILHDGKVSLRAQCKIEEVFTVRRRKFADFMPVKSSLDLVEENDKIVHQISFASELELRKELDIFKFDENYEEHEVEYKALRNEVLSEEDSEDESVDGAENMEVGEENDVDDKSRDTRSSFVGQAQISNPKQEAPVSDMSEAALTNFRRTVYLTIMSAISYEECAHKLIGLMRGNKGKEKELCNMLIECCSQEKTFLSYYALIGRRFCSLSDVYRNCFAETFALHYATIHRFDRRKIRNIGSFYASILATESLPWSVLQPVRLVEEETTSSSRIFLMVVFQQLAKEMTAKGLKRVLFREELAPFVRGLFPKDTAENTRFAINYFTSIKLGILTDDLREHLQSRPKDIGERKVDDDSLSESSELSSSSSSLSSSSSSALSEDSVELSRYRPDKAIAESKRRMSRSESSSHERLRSSRRENDKTRNDIDIGIDARWNPKRENFQESVRKKDNQSRRTTVGRGRGRNLTKPAWMTAGEQPFGRKGGKLESEVQRGREDHVPRRALHYARRVDESPPRIDLHRRSESRKWSEDSEEQRRVDEYRSRTRSLREPHQRGYRDYYRDRSPRPARREKEYRYRSAGSSGSPAFSRSPSPALRRRSRYQSRSPSPALRRRSRYQSRSRSPAFKRRSSPRRRFKRSRSPRR